MKNPITTLFLIGLFFMAIALSVSVYETPDLPYKKGDTICYMGITMTIVHVDNIFNEYYCHYVDNLGTIQWVEVKARSVKSKCN